MEFKHRAVYRISDQTYRIWRFGSGPTNKALATVLGVRPWTPVDIDSIGRVLSVAFVDGAREFIDAKRIEEYSGCPPHHMFAPNELSGNKVLALSEVQKPQEPEEFIVVEHSPAFTGPSIASKNGKSKFTYAEACDIIKELVGQVPDYVTYELFKTQGKAKVTTKIETDITFE